MVQVVPEHGRSHEVRGTLNLVALDFFLNVSVRFQDTFLKFLDTSFSFWTHKINVNLCGDSF